MPVYIGIDPGSRATGYGVVEAAGGAIRYRGSGVLRVGGADPVPVRLAAIKRGVDGIIAEYRPAAMAVEAGVSFSGRIPE